MVINHSEKADKSLNSTDNSINGSKDNTVEQKKKNTLFKGVLLDFPEGCTFDHPTPKDYLPINTSMCTEMPEDIVIPYISR